MTASRAASLAQFQALLRRSLADRDSLGLSLEGFEPIGPLASKL